MGKASNKKKVQMLDKLRAASAATPYDEEKAIREELKEKEQNEKAEAQRQREESERNRTSLSGFAEEYRYARATAFELRDYLDDWFQENADNIGQVEEEYGCDTGCVFTKDTKELEEIREVIDSMMDMIQYSLARPNNPLNMYRVLTGLIGVAHLMDAEHPRKPYSSGGVTGFVLPMTGSIGYLSPNGITPN